MPPVLCPSPTARLPFHLLRLPSAGMPSPSLLSSSGPTPLPWNAQTGSIFGIWPLSVFCPAGYPFLSGAFQGHTPLFQVPRPPSTERCSHLACFLLLCAKLPHFCICCSRSHILPVLAPTHLCMIWAHPAEDMDVRKGQAEQVLKIRTFSLPVPETPWLLFSNGPNSFS